MKLNKSNVIYDPIAHTYTLEGRELSGITSMIKHQLFPDEYKDVPERILKAAAERGSMVHETCELVDDLGVEPTSDEARAYKAKCDELGFKYVCSEYVVSDNEHFASPIDKVYEGAEGGVILGDIKTTYKLNREYVQWQLSIYAYFFEMLNPEIKVERLVAIWLRGEKAEFVDVGRIPTADVCELMRCELAGEQYKRGGEQQVLPESFYLMQTAILDLQKEAKALEEKRKAMLKDLQEAMAAANVKKWETDLLMATIKADSERESFDTKAFAADYPDLYKQYVKKTKVKGSLVLTDKRK